MHGLLPAYGLKVFKSIVVKPDLEWVFIGSGYAKAHSTAPVLPASMRL